MSHVAAKTRPRGRPTAISTTRLLAIAREVFLEKGIRATSADVAVRAGVSEGTLFHRFGTKDALFRAAMNFDPTVDPPLLTKLASLAGQGDLRENLVELGLGVLEIGSVALPMMMMAWSNPASEFSFEKTAECGEERARRRIDALRRFFAAEQEHGRIARSADPGVLARVFFGSMKFRCMEELLFPRGTGRPPREEYVRGVVDLLLDGAAAKNPRRPKARR